MLVKLFFDNNIEFFEDETGLGRKYQMKILFVEIKHNFKYHK